jgi:hypothetical protein
MATSTNYGWAEPDNSSLVKNGASDIRTLGNAIDTSVWNVGYGQAGKNKIINADFNIWQRGTTFNACATGTYTADRWSGIFVNGTVNVTQQSFTAGTAPVAGYESKYFWQLARTSTAGTNDYFGTKIEDVRTYAGQTVTYSFWAKSSSASKSVLFYLTQNFGSGGSASVDIAASTAANLTTSWARYSATFTVPSIAGKTIGTGSYLGAIFALQIADGNNTWSIWGVQLETGSTATPFQTASGGDPQSELAMCQRYCQLVGVSGVGMWFSTTTCQITWPLPITMRVAPSVTLLTSTPTISDAGVANRTGTGSTIGLDTTTSTAFKGNINGFTVAVAGRVAQVASDNMVRAEAEL